MSEYLQLILLKHQSQQDRQYVESVFEQQSTTAQDEDEPEGVNKKIVTKGNAILAYEDIFKMWSVDLSLEEHDIVRNMFFENVWKKYENKDD